MIYVAAGYIVIAVIMFLYLMTIFRKDPKFVLDEMTLPVALLLSLCWPLQLYLP